MASEQEMMADLAAADASGDTQLAQHIAGMIKAARQGPMGGGTAALSGAAQGATLGWGDEMKAGWRSLFSKENGGKPYREGLAEERGLNDSARAQHPYLYGGGELVGGALPLGVGSGSKLLNLLMAAGQGVVQGAGYSNADTAKGVARDGAIGGGLGAGGFGLGEALSGIGSGVARFARSRSTAAVAKAGEQAAEEVVGKIGTATGELGGEVQKGSRQIENMMRLEASMTPQQQALYASLHPEMEQLKQRVAQSTLEAFPSQAGAIASKDAELASLKSGASAAFQSRKAELLKPSFGADAASLAKSYAEPLIAGAVAPPGMKTAAATLFGRTRAGKALMTRITRPGNQKAVFDALESATESKPGELLRLLLSRGGPAAATQSLVEQ